MECQGLLGPAAPESLHGNVREAGENSQLLDQ